MRRRRGRPKKRKAPAEAGEPRRSPERKRRAKIGYMISAVAERYQLHPQTLRLYEREGLLTPSRSEGNTRLYTEEDLERLELILNLTRELGVNLAGVEVILNMRDKLEQLRGEMEKFAEFVNEELERMRDRSMQQRFRTALVRVARRPPAADPSASLRASDEEARAS